MMNQMKKIKIQTGHRLMDNQNLRVTTAAANIHPLTRTGRQSRHHASQPPQTRNGAFRERAVRLQKAPRSCDPPPAAPKRGTELQNQSRPCQSPQQPHLVLLITCHLVQTCLNIHKGTDSDYIRAQFVGR